MAEINLIKEETIDAQVTDINYIPAYKVAEEERRKNELERVSNENKRITYYEEIQRKVDNGEFNGKDGIDGKDGETQDLSNYYNKNEIDNMIGDIESVLNEVV